MPLFHHTIHAAPETRLFRDVHEARRLWSCLTLGYPDLVALVLLPDRAHIALPRPEQRLSRVLSGYARWRQARRGVPGPTWSARAPPIVLGDPTKMRHTVRQLLLEPVNRQLVGDPLAWEWSTHRDQCGFASPCASRSDDPDRRHAEVTDGASKLPSPQIGSSWTVVKAAVGTICRTDALNRRGHARSLAVKTGWRHGLRDSRIYAELGLTRSAVYQIVHAFHHPAEQACVAAAGDARFAEPCAAGQHGGWWLYRHLD